MEMVKKFQPLALLLMIIGALTWGILGLTGTNVLAEVFGTGTLIDVIYVVVGVAGLISIPKMLEGFHIGAGPHPRGA